MSETRDFIDDYQLPEDVLEDLAEAKAEIDKLRRSRKKKLRYPPSNVIYDVVREVAIRSHGLDPQDFPEAVRRRLSELGYYPGLVSDRRIWDAYQRLVLRRIIPDTFGLIKS